MGDPAHLQQAIHGGIPQNGHLWWGKWMEMMINTHFFGVPYVWTNPRSDWTWNILQMYPNHFNRLMAFRHPIHSDANIWVPIRARMIMLYIYTQYIYTQYIYSIYTRLYSIYTLSIISKKPLRGDQSHDEKSSSYTPLPLSVITNCLFVVCVYIYIYIMWCIYIYIDIID